MTPLRTDNVDLDDISEDEGIIGVVMQYAQEFPQGRDAPNIDLVSEMVSEYSGNVNTRTTNVRNLVQGMECTSTLVSLRGQLDDTAFRWVMVARGTRLVAEAAARRSSSKTT